VLLVCRFAPDDETSFLDRARRALPLLAEQSGCRGAELGRASDDPGRWLLVASFDSVAAYRRALSPFAVREHVVPWLSEALADEPATFERRLSAEPGGGVTEHDSLRSSEVPRRS
jgi:quinol monooxygenase YgiN